MRRRFAIAALCVAVGSAPALAIFGIGLTVFDPTSWGELVEQLNQMEKEYSQLVSTYQMVTNQYNQMVTDAKMITSKTRWKALLTPWKFPAATNTYGTTGGWISALNTGAGAQSGYQQAVTPINTYGSVWGSIDSAQQDQIGRNYATIELSDGVTVNALEQLGTTRANSDAVENAIDGLESDSLSDEATMNTEVGVLNKINAAGIINVRNSQDTNKLLASLLDHQMIEAKSRRDAQAQSINNDIALRQNAPAIDAEHFSGSTSILASYRLP
jgi:hypothetical protein